MAQQGANFRFYETSISVRAPFDFIQRLKLDFQYFLSNDTNEGFPLSLHFESETPKTWKRKFSLGRFHFYRAPRGVRRVCFFGKAWVEYDFEKRARIYTEDHIAGYEALFLTILSYVGESLDHKGWHRLHGYGLRLNDQGGVILAGSGTGKSTLALEMIERSKAEILSDDTPLVGGSQMRAFPQRIAIKERPDVPDSFLHTFLRDGHEKKYVLGSAYFSDRICQKSSVDWLFLAKRSSKARVKELSKWRALWPVMKWLVVGYETPQIWPLYLRSSRRIVRAFLSRLGVANRLLSSSRVAELGLSRKPAETRTVLEGFLQ